MNWLTYRAADWQRDAERLRTARYGVIHAADGAWQDIELRPWPKLLSLPELWTGRYDFHARGPADRCWLYYNQPRRFSQFLALKYVVTSRGSRYATFQAALRALDQLAALKGVDALLCDAANRRISERFLQRQGWVAHKPQRWRRNFIKRFYGTYPSWCETFTP